MSIPARLQTVIHLMTDSLMPQLHNHPIDLCQDLITEQRDIIRQRGR